MRVYQIPVTRHPMLVSLWKLLEECQRPPQKDIEVVGDLQADIASGPPAEDRQAATVRVCAPLNGFKNIVTRTFPDLHIRGSFYYPPGGGMSWHTNSDAPGWRIYVVRAPEEKSYFGTRSGVVLDRNGYADVFQAGRGSWHYVVAPTERWSLGLLPTDEMIASLALD